MVCRFLELDNVEEFWLYLMNKEDMVIEDDRRWMFGFYGLLKRGGKFKDIKYFDVIFFGVYVK